MEEEGLSYLGMKKSRWKSIDNFLIFMIVS